MSDFVNDFWNIYVAFWTTIGIVFCVALLIAMSGKRKAPGAQAELHGHVWDEDLTEYNNPLPMWWMWLFYLTIAFAIAYLVLYPGFGRYRGVLDWTSTGEHKAEIAHADLSYGPIFNRYLAQPIAAVAGDAEAHAVGQRLFLNYCAQCHGSDAGGGIGFPNLRDADWLYGGEPEAIKTSILGGRSGVMPPLGDAVGGAEGARQVAHHVFSLGGRTHDPIKAAYGKEKFAVCAACHGSDGKGNHALGAPNLTDKIWLYGGSEEAVVESILKGRKGVMPPHKDFLGEAKAHVLAAYVYGLSAEQAAATPPAPAAVGKAAPAADKK